MEFTLAFKQDLNSNKQHIFEITPKSQANTNPFLDYKKYKKLFKLCLSSNNGFIQNDLIHFRVSMIHFQINGEEKVIKSIGNNLKESFFLIDFAGETELFLENFFENSYLQYPLRPPNNHIFLKREIMTCPSLNRFKQALIKEMGLPNLTSQQNYKCFMLSGKKGSGKKELLSIICKKFGLNYFETDAKKTSSLKSLEKNLRKAINLRPVIINIRNFKSLLHVVSNKVYQDPQKAFIFFIKDFLQDYRNLTKALVDPFICHLFLTCDKFEDLDPFDNEVKNYFDFIEKMPDLDLKELESLWEKCLKNSFSEEDVIKELAVISKGIPWKNILKIYEKEKNNGDGNLENIKKSIESYKKNKEFDNPSIPNVKWEDVGGLVEAKNDIIDTIMLPQQYPQIFNEFLRPRTGLLFYGPPGFLFNFIESKYAFKKAQEKLYWRNA